jgi:hypothetical protein
MPIIIKNGQQYQIPFDPEFLAGAMYDGHTVLPDPDASPEQIQAEDAQIQNSLKRLWGDQQRRTVPDRFSAPEKTMIPDTFDAGQSFDTFGEKQSNFLKVLPNPDILYRTPFLQNRLMDMQEVRGPDPQNSLLAMGELFKWL